MTRAVYAVGREKVREYAYATGETDPRHLDPDAARAAGYADVVAPPMFAAVYCAPAIGPAILDPEVGHRLLAHGPRRPARSRGTLPSSRATRSPPSPSSRSSSERGGLSFFVFRTISTNAATARP